MIRSKLSLSAAQKSFFPGTLSFAVIMRWTLAVETIQHSAISVNVRFAVAFRAWIEAFCLLRCSSSRCLVYGFSSADMIPYYSLACFGKLTLEKPFYLACIAKNTQLVMRQRPRMNDLPVIGYHAMRKELCDRQGPNIVSR